MKNRWRPGYPQKKAAWAVRAAAGFFWILLLALAFSCSPPRDTEIEGRDPGDVEVEIIDVDGEVLERLMERGGRVLLVFWTTRCPYCVQSIPALNAFYEEYGEEFAVLGVNIGESAERVARFAGERAVAYPVGLDRDGSLAREFNVRGVPAYILLGAGGKVEYSGHSLEEMKAGAGF